MTDIFHDCVLALTSMIKDMVVDKKYGPYTFILPYNEAWKLTVGSEVNGTTLLQYIRRLVDINGEKIISKIVICEAKKGALINDE